MSEITTIQKALSGIFPPTRLEVLTDGRRTGHREWSIVVHPRGDGDLAEVLKLARQHQIPLRIGGRAVSGKPRVTLGGAIRVDMTGMDRVISLEEESLLIRVQAGISIAVLKSRLSEKRLMMGWSIYSERPHTLGAVLAGRVAARWGGKFGRPQDTLRSMTAVLPDGGIVGSPAAPRRAAGPDMAARMVGTEGRLGVISEVTLRVFPWPADREILSLDLSLSALARLHELFGGSNLPQLLEVDVNEDGSGQAILALAGEKSEVVRLRSFAVETLGCQWDVEPGLPPRPEPGPGSVVITWKAFHAFLEVWETIKSRKPFSVVECTATSLRLIGGNQKAVRAALDALPGLRRARNDGAISHLESLKEILDGGNVLGPISGRDPIC